MKGLKGFLIPVREILAWEGTLENPKFAGERLKGKRGPIGPDPDYLGGGGGKTTNVLFRLADNSDQKNRQRAQTGERQRNLEKAGSITKNIKENSGSEKGLSSTTKATPVSSRQQWEPPRRAQSRKLHALGSPRGRVG